MNRLTSCLFVTVLSLTSIAFSQPAAPNSQPGWLNARDCGASGSRFQTTANAVAGSKQIVVADPGDFQVGQGVMVSKCNVRYSHKSLWGPHDKYAANRPLKDEVEVRGYDGAAGSWVTYHLDVAPAAAGAPLVFRWTDDLGRTWQPAVPITYDWQPLSGGTEVRFKRFEWNAGYTVAIAGRDQLVSVVERIEGKTLTLRDPANRTVDDAVVRHNDTDALQAAISQAIKEKNRLWVPIGQYRLAGSLTVKDAAAIVIEGESPVETLLDISEGEGPCFRIQGGMEVTIRNFSMVGHMGFDERDKAGLMRTKGGTAVWGMYFKSCSALGIQATERVLVENCHARRMSVECFYSAGRGRVGSREPRAYTKSITYLRCSVEDCARNAFNNNDHAENTSVLQCRIRDVGGCSWEGASRFVRFIGNYVRNGGTVAMGNIRSRAEHLEQLASGQHIIADNVFESGVPYGGCMIRAAGGANQVIVRNNLFVNFNGSAVSISGATGPRDLPAASALVAGNIFDMTAVDEEPKPRVAVDVTACDVTVSDNQVYVRGACDPLLTGIQLRDDALNLIVHDNLLRNCGAGVSGTRLKGSVSEAVDERTFLRIDSSVGPPLARRNSDRYRGWNVVWFKKGLPDGTSVIDQFDPESCRFTLREPRAMKFGDAFEVYPPSANWNLHDNTIAGCLKPVALDGYGSATSLLRNNLISRGDVEAAQPPLQIRGRFIVAGNHLSGFDGSSSH